LSSWCTRSLSSVMAHLGYESGYRLGYDETGIRLGTELFHLVTGP
jgi:hypothetical protein